MLKYREFITLSAEEIEFIVKKMFPETRTVDNIVRHEGFAHEGGYYTCNIYIMENAPDYADVLELYLPDGDSCGVETHDFDTREEAQLWQKFLLAKGMDWRLKDNPFLKEEN